MKVFKYLFYSIFVFVVSLGVVDAAALSMSTSTRSAVVGNTISVTVSASGAAGWEYCVNYNSSVFSLVSANSDTGGPCVRTGSTLTGYSKVTFKFKAIKSGSSTFSLRDAAMYGDDGSSVSSSKGSVSVTARTQAEIQASYSDNANLKSLGVEGFDITPAFDKDTLEYELVVENDVTKVNVLATKAQANASVSGAGELELTEGLNKVTIVVTAQKGNQKKYIINITRKELDPINVVVDGKEFTIVRKVDALTVPTYYEAGTVIIQEEEVPCLNSEVTNYQLVGLKDEDGNIHLYRYYEKEAKYELYQQLVTEVINFVPVKTDKLIDGYEKNKDIKINEEKVNVYYSEDDKDYVLIYGINMLSGKTGWYQYDLVEHTFQRYNDTGLNKIKETNKLFLLLLIILGGVFVLAILVIIILVVSKSKLKKKNIKILSLLEELNNRVKSGSIETKSEDKKIRKSKVIKKEN